MTAMSLAGRRTVNWNLLGTLGGEPKIRNKLAASDHAAAHGARVIPLTMPDPQALRLNFASGFVYDMLAGLGRGHGAAARPQASGARVIPAIRRRMAEGSTRRPVVGQLGRHDLRRGVRPGERAVGGPHRRRGGRGRAALMCSTRCATSSSPTTCAPGWCRGRSTTTDEHWRLRAGLWRDPRVIIGGSDAGAHLDTIWTFNCISSLRRTVGA